MPCEIGIFGILHYERIDGNMNLIQSASRYFASLFDPKLAVPAGKVALLVGSLLFIINHGEAWLNNQMTAHRWFSAFLSYVVPYMVSIHGRFSAKNNN